MTEICDCIQTYSIEEHGKNHVIFYGRCPHRHGLNLATLTEIAWNCEVKKLEECLIRGAIALVPFSTVNSSQSDPRKI